MTQSHIALETANAIFEPDEEISPTIKVGRESIPIALRHGMELWWDGSTPTARLDERDGSSKFTRFVNGRIEGKLAEVAFTELLDHYFDVQSEVDWRIYGDYETTDNGDLQHLLNDDGEEVPLGVDFDIKKTKPWNSWLAIRDEIFTKIDEDAPIILTKMRIEDEIQLDPWENADNWKAVDQDDEFRRRLLDFADSIAPIKVEFVGTAYKNEFEEHFEQGERLYDPRTGEKIGPELKRSNTGMFVDNLNNKAGRWNRVAAEICSNMPKDQWRPLPVITK